MSKTECTARCVFILAAACVIILGIFKGCERYQHPKQYQIEIELTRTGRN